MLLNRKAADFYCKLMIIFDAIVSCTKLGTTAKDVGRICGEVVPLALTSNGGAMSEWQNACCLNETISNALAGVCIYALRLAYVLVKCT